MMMKQISGFAAAAILALAIAGCAAMQPTPEQQADQLEPMLSAAGFRMLPADNQQKLDHLQSLPQFQVKYFPAAEGGTRYWMADAQVCHCLYIGDEQAFQQYQKLRFEQHIADEQQQAAEEQMGAAQMQEMNMMNPFMMGGPIWVY
jgi:hypothetical protein